MKFRLVVSHPEQERAYQALTLTRAQAEDLMDKRKLKPGSHVQIFETTETAVLDMIVPEPAEEEEAA